MITRAVVLPLPTRIHPTDPERWKVAWPVREGLSSYYGGLAVPESTPITWELTNQCTPQHSL